MDGAARARGRGKRAGGRTRRPHCVGRRKQSWRIPLRTKTFRCSDPGRAQHAARRGSGTHLYRRRQLDDQAGVQQGAQRLDARAGQGEIGGASTDRNRQATDAGRGGCATIYPRRRVTMLRREQAAFEDVVREESGRNWWMAIPALAPMAVPLLAESGALLAGRLAASQLNRAPLNLLGREQGLGRAPLTEAAKKALRAKARKTSGSG